MVLAALVDGAVVESEGAESEPEKLSDAAPETQRTLTPAGEQVSVIPAWGGYCDQTHLHRDFRQLARTTPEVFIKGLGPLPTVA